jgi:hypothetical protein
MKFMIDVVMLKNALAVLVYDYVLIVAGSRVYADHTQLQPIGNGFKTNFRLSAKTLTCRW